MKLTTRQTVNEWRTYTSEEFKRLLGIPLADTFAVESRDNGEVLVQVWRSMPETEEHVNVDPHIRCVRRLP